MNGQEKSLRARLVDMLHQRGVELTGLENKFPNGDFSQARSALRTADAILRRKFNRHQDTATVNYHLEECQRQMVAVGLTELHPVKQERRPKEEKEVTGNFAGEVHEVKNPEAVLAGKNMFGSLTPDMRAAGEHHQRLLAYARKGVVRGVAVIGAGKAGASEDRRAANARKRKEAAAKA